MEWLESPTCPPSPTPTYDILCWHDFRHRALCASCFHSSQAMYSSLASSERSLSIVFWPDVRLVESNPWSSATVFIVWVSHRRLLCRGELGVLRLFICRWDAVVGSSWLGSMLPLRRCMRDPEGPTASFRWWGGWRYNFDGRVMLWGYLGYLYALASSTWVVCIVKIYGIAILFRRLVWSSGDVFLCLGSGGLDWLYVCSVLH